MKVNWCPVCGGSHAEAQRCPGDLRATGPERHGWRVLVETPYGIEAYGVLVAPSGDLFRARILTYPNILWTVPGGAVTVKFSSRSAQDAESQAIAFIEGHIKALGYTRRDALAAPGVAHYRAEAAVRAAIAQGPALRKMRTMPVQFGTGPTLFSAMTGNLSESGLFVMTLVPFDPGTGVRVLMDLEVGTIGLQGKVVWKRETVVLGRPIGMGIRLVAPPAPYKEFVTELP